MTGCFRLSNNMPISCKGHGRTGVCVCEDSQTCRSVHPPGCTQMHMTSCDTKPALLLHPGSVEQAALSKLPASLPAPNTARAARNLCVAGIPGLGAAAVAPPALTAAEAKRKVRSWIRRGSSVRVATWSFGGADSTNSLS